MAAIDDAAPVDEQCKHAAGRFAPVIDPNRCEGKAACVAECPYDDLRRAGRRERGELPGLGLLGTLKWWVHGGVQAQAVRADQCHALRPVRQCLPRECDHAGAALPERVGPGRVPKCVRDLIAFDPRRPSRSTFPPVRSVARNPHGSLHAHDRTFDRRTCFHRPVDAVDAPQPARRRLTVPRPRLQLRHLGPRGCRPSKTDWASSTSQVSVVLLCAAMGAIFSFPVTAAALHRFGSRGASLLSGVLLSVGLIALGVAPTWSLACAVMFVYGDPGQYARRRDERTGRRSRAGDGRACHVAAARGVQPRHDGGCLFRVRDHAADDLGAAAFRRGRADRLCRRAAAAAAA